MGNLPSVSVALCTFNGARYIHEQLHSIAQQSVVPDELVISDDGSSDDTLAVIDKTLEQLAQSIPAFAATRISVLKNSSPLGVTKNFEQAITATTGDIVVLCDQDDVWLPNKLQQMLAAFSSSQDSVFVFGDADLVDAQGEPLGMTLFDGLSLKFSERNGIEGGKAVDVLIKRNIVTGATAGFTRDIAIAAFPFPAGWVHDEWLAMVAALKHSRFVVLEALLGYRQHDDNQIGVKKTDSQVRIQRLTAKGTERNARLLLRSQELAARAPELEASTRETKLIEKALAFQQARNRFSKNRFARIPQVFAQVFQGRYFSVSNGPRDVLRDFVQPL